MKLSASQAAKKTGKSIPTITRAIKSGKISAEKLGTGGYLIDPSELFRVFNPVTRDPNVTDQMLGHETQEKSPVREDRDRLFQEKIEMLETALSDARAERDEWRDQAKRLATALPSPDSKDASKKPRHSWWPW